MANMDFGIGSIRRSLRKLAGSRHKCNDHPKEAESHTSEAIKSVENECFALNPMQTRVVAEMISSERSYLENLDILLKVTRISLKVTVKIYLYFFVLF